MNKIILICCLALIFTACNNNTSTEQKNIDETALIDTLTYTYDSIKVYSKTVIKTEEHTDTTKAVINFPIFKNDSLNTFIEKGITSYISSNKQNQNYSYLANNFVKGYDNFVNKNKETFQSWFLFIKVNVLNQKKNYIALQYLHADYSGGAHPNTNIFFLNYDTKNNMPITLDMLIDTSNRLELNNIGEGIFRKNENLSSSEKLGEKFFFENGKFFLPKNFYINDKGLIFLYNPYEIKPYVAGTTELIIPFDELMQIIKPNTILSSYN